MDRTQVELLRSKSFGEIQKLLQILKLKDQSTLEHSNRVYALTNEWATFMRSKWKWLDIDVAALELAALLHDVGKVAVMDEVLNKTGALTAIERDHLEQHAEIGYQMVSDFQAVEDVAEGIRHHHERWDGHGYPVGLRENQIPKISQIIAVVDAYDAITSDRPYQKARSREAAIQIIEAEAGRQFAPEVATEFVQFVQARNL